MGMFDTVHVSCPKCNERVAFQSKAGQCMLTDYTLADAPAEVLGDLAGDEATCRGCNETLRIVVSIQAWVETDDAPRSRGRILGRD